MTAIRQHLANLRASMARTESECSAGMCCGAEKCRDRLCPGHPVQRAERAWLERMLREDRTNERVDAGAVFVCIVVACILAVIVISAWRT